VKGAVRIVLKSLSLGVIWTVISAVAYWAATSFWVHQSACNELMSLPQQAICQDHELYVDLAKGLTFCFVILAGYGWVLVSCIISLGTWWQRRFGPWVSPSSKNQREADN